MDIRELLDHRVSIVCTDGTVVEGPVTLYISAEDNDPDPESIGISVDKWICELTEEEIASVTFLD